MCRNLLKKNILDILDKIFKDLKIFDDFPIAALLDPRSLFHKNVLLNLFIS